MRKTVFPKASAEKTEYHTQKKTRSLPLILYRNQFQDLNTSPETLKLLEKNIQKAKRQARMFDKGLPTVRK